MVEQDFYRERVLRSRTYGTGPGWDDPAETYHEASKVYRQTAAALRGPAAEYLDAVPEALGEFGHPEESCHGDAVALPPPSALECGLGATLARRRSRRRFSSRALTLEEVATLLWATYGVGADGTTRPSPSGGALYPLDVWFVASRVESLRGLYKYSPMRHALIRLPAEGERRISLVAHLVRPDLLGSPGAWMLLVAAFWRSRLKYGLRSYRHVLLEAGHAMENCLLAAAALDLAATPLSGYYDDEVDGVIGADGVNVSTVYVAAFGAP